MQLQQQTLSEIWIRGHSLAVTLPMSTLDDSSCISWAAYHSLAKQISVDSTSIIAMLPLFFEKADFPAMVRHSMNLLNKISDLLLFIIYYLLNKISKPRLSNFCIQWRMQRFYENNSIHPWGFTYRKNTGCLGNLLTSSGWTAALTDSFVAKPGRLVFKS